MNRQFKQVGIVQRLRLQFAVGRRGYHADTVAAAIPRFQQRLKIRPSRPAVQRIQMQRHGHQHPLPVMPDRRGEDRPPRQSRVELRFRQMLVFELQRIEFECRTAMLLVILDHRSAATGIAADCIDRDRIVGRDYPRIYQRPDQSNRAGRIASRIGDPSRGCDPLRVAFLHLGEAIRPVRMHTMRRARIQYLRRRVA
jgi:hypothetical protein